MESLVLPSTFFLTVLSLIGLFFFIRASIKDRTTLMRFTSKQDEATLMNALKSYFQSRAYRVISIDANKNQVTFQGFVRPSWFLAIFLTLLAIIGILCLSLIVSIEFPSLGKIFLLLLLLSPLSGILYWRNSGKLEQVLLKMENNNNIYSNIPNNQLSEQPSSSIITLIGHRDELLELQKTLQLHSFDG
ncbi:cofactor assembly of complex C subunit B [Anabaena sp. FACHB-1237]|uniref:cofactor assembly of complex C subunit B n=1 Tax=Anabaena sp. FACHB-1237 TaxID=2692769 RepID=UPI00167FE694|nr:cofactor assembly of complex C subunit B [Anabaena sp. FACHB-1237]MBD2139750.1 cofactor assembly of complex C subunit B [Anabaena sp. FACHB-1237]